MSYIHTCLQSVYYILPASLRGRIHKNPVLKRLKSSSQHWLLGHHQYTYNATYYEWVDNDAIRSRDAMADSIVFDLQPKTLVDIGCGTGALLEAICQRGVSGIGYEYSDAGRDMCQKRGLSVKKFNILTDPIPQEATDRDVAMSFEVAEHLPESGADQFVDLLCGLSKIVVCSAAPPGQGGTEHLNEQPHEYWIAKFNLRGYEYDRALTEIWRRRWEEKKIARFYFANVMLFRKRNS